MLKLFSVFIIYICSIYAYSKKYCEICPNHTLCRYEVSGPSSTCLGYDKKALLTENDIKAIVDQINHRRNFIALGHSNVLPGAANMQKISWSQELATSAQRWVDQCDQTLRPEKEDQCRDLENMKVGQCIATIFGPSPGLNVKSFVEMWFMQSLNYPGEVTYYNESRDCKSNQFTQLIWATTEIVGCGKAKFYVNNNKKTIAERLVCNFAPRGNVHGKPVYIIGYAATQCLDDMDPDIVFSGLCSRPLHTNEVFGNKRSNSGRLLPATPIANSLLRIRNLFNDSAKQEIDPVYNTFKHMKKTCKNESPQSNKKSSSVIVQDSTLDAVKRSHTLNNENFWINHRNTSRNYGDDFNQQNKGHSRVYHGHDHRNEFDSIHPETFFTDSRRFDYATPPSNYHKDRNYRKHNINRQCTRNIGPTIIKNVATECNPCKQKLKCTRGQKINPQTHVCEDREVSAYPQDFCRCHNFQITCPTTNLCIPNMNSECFNFNYPVKRCPNMLRTLGTKVNNNMEKQEEVHYFDLFSNRNYDPTLKQEVKLFTSENINISDEQNLKLLNKRKDNYPNYSEIKRSVSEDDTKFKPFWQIDGFTNKKKPQLKSMKYTTLANRKIRISKRTTSKQKMKTEHITLKLNFDQKENRKPVSEKYLSFDELMHLRKLNTGNFSGRRFHNINSEDDEGKQSLRKSATSAQSETTESTSEYTANTPFIRLKHCTRKLTCTWTAASLTDSAGSVIPGGAGGAAGHMGSRTPPGYVEGCTRTSTCTRDYMNRNKMATIPVETTSPEFDSGDEEDYCERRSLNRRHSNKAVSLKINNLYNKSYSKRNPLNIFTKKYGSNISETFVDCNSYHKNFRNKRNGLMNKRSEEKLLNYRNKKRENIEYETDYSNNIISYGDLYYSVLKKILNTWKSKNSLHSNSKCLCNNTNKINHYIFLVFFSIYIFMQ